jgi:hypothetical protein
MRGVSVLKGNPIVSALEQKNLTARQRGGKDRQSGIKERKNT